jgi:hypothetical protein
MSFLPGLVKLVKKVAKPLGNIIEDLPVIGKVFKTAENITGPISTAVQKAVKLVKKVPLPAAAAGGGLAAGAGIEQALSGGGGAAIPGLPGPSGAVVPYTGGSLPMSMARGGGKAMLLNPNMAAAISAMSIDPSQIPLKYAPPRGYVIVRYGQTVMCIPRAIATHFGLWHAGRKPPISAGDWHKYQTAQRVEKKLRHLAIHALRHHHARTAVIRHKKG